MANRWVRGQSVATIARSLKLKPSSVRVHLLNCIPSAAQYGYDAVGFQELTSTFDELLTVLAAGLTTEDLNRQDYLTLLRGLSQIAERRSRFDMSVRDVRLLHLSCIVSEIAAHYTLENPTSGPATVAEIVAQYPAARAALAEYEQDRKAQNEQHQDETPDW